MKRIQRSTILAPGLGQTLQKHEQRSQALGPTRGLGRGARRRRASRLALTAIAFAAWGSAGMSQAADRAEPLPVQSLDEQVQAIKSDVLAIAAELDNLEERLLFPSETQVAVFVALDGETELSLDSARISINGEAVAHHVYSFKEIEALGDGGVQRLYTGNVRKGEHRIEIELRGERPGGQSFAVVQSGQFEKSQDPKRVGITLHPRLADEPRIAIEDW